MILSVQGTNWKKFCWSRGLSHISYKNCEMNFEEYILAINQEIICIFLTKIYRYELSLINCIGLNHIHPVNVL